MAACGAVRCSAAHAWSCWASEVAWSCFLAAASSRLGALVGRVGRVLAAIGDVILVLLPDLVDALAGLLEGALRLDRFLMGRIEAGAVALKLLLPCGLGVVLGHHRRAHLLEGGEDLGRVLVHCGHLLAGAGGQVGAELGNSRERHEGDRQLLQAGGTARVAGDEPLRLLLALLLLLVDLLPSCDLLRMGLGRADLVLIVLLGLLNRPALRLVGLGRRGAGLLRLLGPARASRMLAISSLIALICSGVPGGSGYAGSARSTPSAGWLSAVNRALRACSCCWCVGPFSPQP